MKKFCGNCESVELLEVHHIVPVSLGGSELKTNKVTLCGKCHMLAHGSKAERKNMVDLIKEGLVRAKESGKVLGRPPATTLDNVQKLKLGGLSQSKSAKELGVSLSTIKRLWNE